MVLIILGVVTGAFATVWFFLPLMFYVPVYEIGQLDWLTVALLGLFALIGGLVGGLLGYIVSMIVGRFVPQNYEDTRYRIGSLKEETHVMHRHQQVGKTTIMVPYTYTTYEYTYYQDGEYQPDSVRTEYATITFTNDLNVSLVIREYYFTHDWYKWLASEYASHYTFYVPRGTDFQ